MKQNRHTIYAAVYLFLYEKNKILLLRRYNTGWQDGKYSMVSGHIDAGETVHQAMTREANEEAGIIIRPEDLQVIHVMHRKSEAEDRIYVDFFLKPKSWKGIPVNRESNKSDDLRWFPVKDLPVNTLANVVSAITNYFQHIYFSEFGWD